MIFVNWIRNVRGYVRFSVTGVFVERFLNLTALSGINIWDVKHIDKENKITACINASDYKKLRKPAQKAMVHLKVTEKYGIPFERYKYRKRIGLLIGVILSALLMIIMSMFIWRIDINGLDTIEENVLREKLKENGVFIGSLRKSIDVRHAENEIMIEVPEISWIAINLDGSTATIEVNERVMPPTMLPDDDILCNIVAAKSGQITRMEVYAGKEVANVGDAVKEGDLIVSGILEDKVGKTTFKHARAKIFAEIEEKIKIEVPKEKIIRERIGQTEKKHSVVFFNCEIPLFWGKLDSENNDIVKHQKDFEILGIQFSTVNYDVTPVKNKTIILTEHEAKEEAMKKLAEEEKRKFEDCKIISKDLKFAATNDEKEGFFIEAEYKYEQNIALEKQILTEN